MLKALFACNPDPMQEVSLEREEDCVLLGVPPWCRGWG